MQHGNTIICLIGLGYVGLPVAVALAKKYEVIGFDINEERILGLKKFHDSTCQITSQELEQSKILFTSTQVDLKKANFFIVTVPTPVDKYKKPDFTPLIEASKIVGQTLKKGDIVVYESTVFPGATEDICLPVLQRESGLTSPQDFCVGYSPERINPGDKVHTFTTIKKVISAQNAATLEKMQEVYGSVVEAGLYSAPTIKVAEASKLIENVQRDLNVSLMNELALIFDKLNIDTQSVLEASSTKWNFLKFTPGLVGGHCIGVDPYYLTYKAEELGYSPQVILSGRRINDGMGKFIAEKTIKEMIKAGHDIAKSIITVLGLTFKENCPDIRNTKVVDVIEELQDYGIQIQIHDQFASPKQVKEEYGLDLTPFDQLNAAHSLLFTVAHKAYLNFTLQDYKKYSLKNAVIIDVKGICPKNQLLENNFRVWRL